MSSDAHTAARRPRSGAAVVLGGLGGLVGMLAVLYLVPAALLGMWEPWETSLATLGRFVATTDGVSAFAPVRDGALVTRPWLEVWLLSHGYSLGGGTELGFRLPLALLVITAAGFGFVVLRHFFGTVRALCAAALFAVVPFVLLSAINLAGDAAYEAILTLTMLTVAVLVGEWEGPRPFAVLALGPLLALCLWGGGALGLGMPLAAMALYAVGSHEDRFAGDASMFSMFLGGLVALAGVCLPLVLVKANGWDATKDLVGVGVAVFLPLALLLIAAPGSRARFLFDPVYTPVALLIFGVMAGLPALEVAVATEGLDGFIQALLYHDFLSGRVLPEHVTFDVLVRLVGASAFPTVVLVPFGFAYLFRSYDGGAHETDDPLDGSRAVKQLLTVWMAAGFLIYGLGSSLAGNYAFPVSFPMAAAAALALGDVRFRRAFDRNRFVLYAAGFTALLLLAMTSKDIRGMANEDLGQPGPHVVFERLLTDGSVEFPATYAFASIPVFMLSWALLLALSFGEPLRNLTRLGLTVRDWATSRREPRGRVGRLFGRITVPVMRGLAWCGRQLVTAADRTAGWWQKLSRGTPTPTIAVVAFTLLTVGWGFHLAFIDVPAVTHHLSQKGMMDTFESLADEGTTLYVGGIGSNDNSYYLGEGPVEHLDRVSAVRDLFCEAEGRVFAVVPFDSLADAHYAARHEREGDDPCDAPQPIYVVDGRSSRYVLLSNQLDEAAGEENQSVVAENVFTAETLPETAQPYEGDVVVDGKLRLVAVELPTEPVSRGPFDVVAYWEVLERPTSSYEAFIHVDFGGNRLNGDHDPVHGYYPMRYWVPGEVVRDSHTMEVSRADRAGEYTVFYGFFRGDNRMRVVGGTSDNRVNLGTITVR